MLYIPERGDIVWVDFNLQQGKEQTKRRPAIILSAKLYNKASGLCILCPISSKQKGYPFEVNIEEKKVEGVILSDQIKSFDWQQRKATFICKAPKKIMNECLEKIKVLIGF